MITNPTERFSGRVENYRRFRPGYPHEVVELLRRECGLGSGSLIADIAAGTGIFTEVLLGGGFAVTAIEPNDEMRAACVALRDRFSNLRVVSGRAEETGLPAASFDLITVAQAMHWFDLGRTREEFARILRPGGFCAVIYNNRRLGGDPFHEGYERLMLEFGIDYGAVKQQHVGRKRLAGFFAPHQMTCASIPNPQPLTLEELSGRILSASYMPQPGQPRFEEMRAAVEKLFTETQSGGTVTMHQDCLVCWGQLV